MNKNIIATDLTEQQRKDTGLALILILLIIGLVTENILFFKLTIPVILVTMLFPSILHPLAIIWFTFSNILGFFISKIILSIIFLILIVPFGLIRRLIGKDSLQLRQFKASKNSVLINRDHIYTRKDIIKPF
ncbi:MAG: SxtJ family membrane protein [Candidatus Neomarinimicrobiota bacterium]